MLETLIGIMVPFIGTILGSAIVFFAKDKLPSKVEKLLLGFASGVMIAASIWSLIIPSIEMGNDTGKLSVIPASVGFVLGMLFLLGLDTFLPHLHIHSNEAEGVRSKLKEKTMMFFAATLHNLPEGMAIGVLFAGFLMGNAGISLMGALTLAIGIAIQNIPEGAIVAFDMKNKGSSNKKSFLYGVISGAVEPLGSLLVILFSALLTFVIPYFLAFAAGAMIYVVVEELIPQSQEGKHSNIATIGVTLGFTLMMILDIVLG